MCVCVGGGNLCSIPFMAEGEMGMRVLLESPPEKLVAFRLFEAL